MVKFIIVVLLSITGSDGFSATCQGNDKHADICKLPEAPGTRCAKFEHFRNYCDNTTDGCNKRCYGFVPSGHWYPLADNSQAPRWRCRCGCVAESMEFEAIDGIITAKELVERRNSNLQIASWDYLGSRELTFRPIDTVVWAKEDQGVFIALKGSRHLILSKSHPVVVSGRAGEVLGLKKASELAVKDLLLTDSGQSVEIENVTVASYGLDMVNFNVTSSKPSQRFIAVNGIMTGDLAWQETIHQSGSRKWFRADILKAIEDRKEKRND